MSTIITHAGVSLSWDSVPFIFNLRLLWAVHRRPETALHIQHVAFLSSHERTDDVYWRPHEARDEIRWKEEIAQFPDVVEHAQEQLKQVTSFVLARSPLTDREVYSLLKVAPNLQALHMGISYHELPLL